MPKFEDLPKYLAFVFVVWIIALCLLAFFGSGIVVNFACGLLALTGFLLMILIVIAGS